jgi:hypothetical protein
MHRTERDIAQKRAMGYKRMHGRGKTLKGNSKLTKVHFATIIASISLLGAMPEQAKRLAAKPRAPQTPQMLRRRNQAQVQHVNPPRNSRIPRLLSSSPLRDSPWPTSPSRPRSRPASPPSISTRWGARRLTPRPPTKPQARASGGRLRRCPSAPRAPRPRVRS